MGISHLALCYIYCLLLLTIHTSHSCTWFSYWSSITLLHPFSFCMPFFSLTHPLKNLILPFFFYCLLWKKLFLLSFSVLFVLSYYYWFLLYEYLSINLSSGCHQSMYHYFTILNWFLSDLSLSMLSIILNFINISF